MAKHMDHITYPKSLRVITEDALHYIIKDAREAIAAWPDGENAGYYADEIHYAGMELRRRRKYLLTVGEADWTPDSPVEYAPTLRVAYQIRRDMAEGIGLPQKAISITKIGG